MCFEFFFLALNSYCSDFGDFNSLIRAFNHCITPLCFLPCSSFWQRLAGAPQDVQAGVQNLLMKGIASEWDFDTRVSNTLLQVRNGCLTSACIAQEYVFGPCACSCIVLSLVRVVFLLLLVVVAVAAAVAVVVVGMVLV